jgi:Ca2+:H+ antiporter
MRWMLIFVPVSIALHFVPIPAVWTFVLACLGIVPLAGLMGTATEELAKYRGPGVGGLLNATFGNATELIIGIVAVQQNELQIVKASLIGSVIGNVLLVMGLSTLLGGIKYKIQTFSADAAQSHASMMSMAVISLLVPALFVRAVPGLRETAANSKVEALSLGVATVLILLYVGSLVFSLYTHETLFRSQEECAEQPEWKQSSALATLAVATVLIAIESELLVGSIGATVQQWGLSKLFVGIIIVPIVGNAAEHSTAVMMALRNKMDISMNIAVSSSTQVAMFVAPVLIFISLLVGHPMTILFSNFELIALTAAVGIAVLISMDGKSHWLEGAQLLAVYIIVALAFYFVAG